MPVDLPGGSMVYCVRHFVLPRLNTGAGVAFFFPLLNEFSKPLI
ncbi:pyrBI operon leader peptide [Raoultella ornithinolytica]